jgi:hypothetical protein
MPDLAVLRDILAGDGTLGAREMGEVRAAVRFISAIEWTPAPDNPQARFCVQCGEAIMVNPQMATEPQAPPVCLSCWFWLERCAMAALVTSGAAQWHPGAIRAQGQHYSLLPMPLDVRRVSELVTVCPYLPGQGSPGRPQRLSRIRLVTPRLYCQGAVPEAYREYLGDNAVIVKGDPYKLGIGFHEMEKGKESAIQPLRLVDPPAPPTV